MVGKATLQITLALHQVQHCTVPQVTHSLTLARACSLAPSGAFFYKRISLLKVSPAKQSVCLLAFAGKFQTVKPTA
jgi:hypothetical protein